MSNETPPLEPEKPQRRDESWNDLHKFFKAAVDSGITNTSEMAELLEATKNEDFRAKGLAVINEIAEQMDNWRELIKRLDELLGGRESVAEQQHKTELVLLERIQELGKEALAEDLRALAEAYNMLRSVSVAPGGYTPDERHSGK